MSRWLVEDLYKEVEQRIRKQSGCNLQQQGRDCPVCGPAINIAPKYNPTFTVAPDSVPSYFLGIPVHLNPKLKPGTVVLATIDSVDRYFTGPLREQVEIDYSIKIVDGPYEVVTGDDLQLLKQARELRRLGQEVTRWKDESDKQYRVRETADDAARSADEKVRVARQQSSKLITDIQSGAKLKTPESWSEGSPSRRVVWSK